MEKSKRSRYLQLERIVRGFSNHRRIEILELLQTYPELSVADIAKRLRINLKTASSHIQRLAVAGLIMKRSDAASIRHRLTNRGLFIMKYIKELEDRHIG